MLRSSARLGATVMQDFSAKLALVLKVLSISRGRLSAELGVDKSVVSRWLGGLYTPSGENLSQLTRYVASRIPGFTGLDWERSLEDLQNRMTGAEAAQPVLAAADAALSATTVPHARTQSVIEVQREGNAYPGLYAQFRVAFRNSGEMLAELMIIWREGDRLCFRSFDPSFSHTGEILIVRHQLFFIGEDDARADGLNFLVANGVPGQKAYRIDNIALSVAGDRHRTPGACPGVMQRIADLDGPPSTLPRELLVAICERMKAAFVEGTTPAIAGPRIEAAVRAQVGRPRDDGRTDHFLRMPMERSILASEVDLTPDLIAELQSVREAFVGQLPAPALSFGFDFESPQLAVAWESHPRGVRG